MEKLCRCELALLVGFSFESKLLGQMRVSIVIMVDHLVTFASIFIVTGLMNRPIFHLTILALVSTFQHFRRNFSELLENQTIYLNQIGKNWRIQQIQSLFDFQDLAPIILILSVDYFQQPMSVPQNQRY